MYTSSIQVLYALGILMQHIQERHPQEVDRRRSVGALRYTLPESGAHHGVPLWQVGLAPYLQPQRGAYMRHERGGFYLYILNCGLVTR